MPAGENAHAVLAHAAKSVALKIMFVYFLLYSEECDNRFDDNLFKLLQASVNRKYERSRVLPFFL